MICKKFGVTDVRKAREGVMPTADKGIEAVKQVVKVI